MFRLFFSFAFLYLASAQVCSPADSAGPPQGNPPSCQPGEPQVLGTDTDGNPACCPTDRLITTAAPTTVAGATDGSTAAPGETTAATAAPGATTAAPGAATTTATCVDKLNPRTGVSDCPSRANLCNDPNYIDIMTRQCPKTCNRCSSATTGSSTASGSCVDLVNPRTGVSDCPSMANLCNDSNYITLMTTQCPRTCGRCTSATGTTSAGTATTTATTGTCVDQTNPATGRSDCPARRNLCNNSAYASLMRQQCPATCGFC